MTNKLGHTSHSATRDCALLYNSPCTCSATLELFLKHSITNSLEHTSHSATRYCALLYSSPCTCAATAEPRSTECPITTTLCCLNSSSNWRSTPAVGSTVSLYWALMNAQSVRLLAAAVLYCTNACACMPTSVGLPSGCCASVYSVVNACKPLRKWHQPIHELAQNTKAQECILGFNKCACMPI